MGGIFIAKPKPLFDRLVSQIKTLNSEIEKKRQQRNMLLEQLQMHECAHLSVVERAYRKTDYSIWAPRRLCTICGVEEEGWGRGYQVLFDHFDHPTRTVKVVSSCEEFYSYRQPDHTFRMVGQSA